MKKTILFSAVAVLCMLMGFSFVSCGDDDANVLVGSWYKEGRWNSYTGAPVIDYDIWLFKSDGTGTRRSYRESSDKGVWFDDIRPFFYTIISAQGDHGVVRISYTDNNKSADYIYSIVSNTLTLGDDVYRKGSPSI